MRDLLMHIPDYYDSPINLLTTHIDTQIADECMRITQKYDLDIDEKKLIQAITADSDRYREAYRNGYSDAIKSVQEKLRKVLFDDD